MIKIITLGILIILGLSCILPTIIGFPFKSEGQAVGEIIIVDDENDGDFVRIKDALNYVNPGDTIEVYSGTYDEHTIIIDKKEITLLGISHELGHGYDTGKPFVNGPGTDQDY